jgi:hypothetical protein
LGASFLSPQAASSVSSKPGMMSLLDRVLLCMKFRHIKESLIAWPAATGQMRDK